MKIKIIPISLYINYEANNIIKNVFLSTLPAEKTRFFDEMNLIILLLLETVFFSLTKHGVVENMPIIFTTLQKVTVIPSPVLKFALLKAT